MRETVIAEHRGVNPPAAWKSVEFELTVGADRTAFELAIRRLRPGHWELIQRVRRVPVEDESRRLVRDGDTREIWPRRAG